MDVVDGLLFAFAGLATIWLALSRRQGKHPTRLAILLLVVFWVLLTYLLLPRLHRILTQACTFPDISLAAPGPVTAYSVIR